MEIKQYKITDIKPYEKNSKMHDKTQINYEFVKSLKKYPITSQQRHTLKGQALSGNFDEAMKGLQKCLVKNNLKF